MKGPFWRRRRHKMKNAYTPLSTDDSLVINKIHNTGLLQESTFYIPLLESPKSTIANKVICEAKPLENISSTNALCRDHVENLDALKKTPVAHQETAVALQQQIFFLEAKNEELCKDMVTGTEQSAKTIENLQTELNRVNADKKSAKKNVKMLQSQNELLYLRTSLELKRYKDHINELEKDFYKEQTKREDAEKKKDELEIHCKELRCKVQCLKKELQDLAFKKQLLAKSARKSLLQERKYITKTQNEISHKKLQKENRRLRSVMLENQTQIADLHLNQRLLEKKLNEERKIAEDCCAETERTKFIQTVLQDLQKKLSAIIESIPRGQEEISSKLEHLMKSCEQHVQGLAVIEENISQVGFKIDELKGDWVPTDIYPKLNELSLDQTTKETLTFYQEFVGADWRSFYRGLGLDPTYIHTMEMFNKDISFSELYWNGINGCAVSNIDITKELLVTALGESTSREVSSWTPLSLEKKQFINQISNDLEERIVLPKDILHKMRSTIYVSEAMLCYIADEDLKFRQIRKLLRLLPSLGESALEHFVSALTQSGEEDTANFIVEEEKKVHVLDHPVY